MSGTSIYLKLVLFHGSRGSLFNFQLFNVYKPNQSHKSVIGTAKGILARVFLAHMLLLTSKNREAFKVCTRQPRQGLSTENPDGHAAVTCLYDVISDQGVTHKTMV